MAQDLPLFAKDSPGARGWLRYRIVGFETPNGPVRHHCIKVYNCGTPEEPDYVERVNFWTFSSEAQCEVILQVRIQEFSRFVKRCPNAHTIQSVVTAKGRTINATYLAANWGEYLWPKVPELARGIFAARHLMGGNRLFEIDGVDAMLHHANRTGEVKLDLCPNPYPDAVGFPAGITN